MTSFQDRSAAWMGVAFKDDPTDGPERRDRVAEEVCEGYQADGGTLEDWIAIGRYTFGRPSGSLAKEFGQTIFTVACWAAYRDINMMAEAERELARCSTPEFIEKLARKRATRHGRGPLPGFSGPETSDPGVAPGPSPTPDGVIKERGSDEQLQDLTRARDIAEHQRNCLFEFIHGAGVRLGVIDPKIACGAPQLMAAMDAYFDHLAAASTVQPPSFQAGGVGETFDTIRQWCEETFGPATPERIASRAAEEMDELLADPSKVEEAADIVIILSRHPTLWAEIERKMSVNRKRQWRLMGDGTGYHVKEAAPRPSQREG